MSGSEAAPEKVVFESVHHPTGRPYALVFSQSVVHPISILFLPLMILTLIAALQHMPVLSYLLWGFPAATAAAFLWTAFKLRREIADLAVEGRMVAIRSIHEAARRGGTVWRMMPLFDVRDYGDWLVVAAGDADYVIAREEWPNFEAVRVTLHQAVYSATSR